MPARDLRLIVNSRCNYSCFYCHREGLTGHHKELLNSDDYGFIYRVIKKAFGINKVEITGGEPLLRKDLDKIIKTVKDDRATLKLITNGSYIKEKMRLVMQFDIIYVSIASLDEEKYHQIHGVNCLSRIKEGINLLIKTGKTISINVPLADGMNGEEITDFINFGETVGANIRFLEIQTPRSNRKLIFPKAKIISELAKRKYEISRTTLERTTYFSNKISVSLIQYYCLAETSGENNYNNRCYNNHGYIFTPDGQLMICREDQSRNLNLLTTIKERNGVKFSAQIKEAVGNYGKFCVRY